MSRTTIFFHLYCICAGFIFFTTALHAQSPVSNESFTVKEGLSENVIHCLFQDKKGFLWIGTHEGLNKYDGYSFRKYLHNKNDSTSLPNGPIVSLYESEPGTLTMESPGVVYKMDMTTGRFRPAGINFAAFYGRNISFLKNVVNANLLIDPRWYPVMLRDTGRLIPITILQKTRLQQSGCVASCYDENRRLWILTKHQLAVVDEQGKETTIINGLSHDANDAKLFRWLYNDLNGNIWLRVPGKLYCIDKVSLEIKTSVLQSQIGDFPMENLTSVSLDKNGVCWMGSFYGLKKLNLNRQPFRHFIYGIGDKHVARNFILGLNIHSGNRLTLQHFYVDSVFSEIDLTTMEIRQHNVATYPLDRYMNEVLIRNNRSISGKNWSSQLRKMSSIPFERRTIRYMYADREGVIWLFHEGRVINLNDDRSVFITGPAEAFWDDEKYLWIATTTNGLFRYNKFNGGIKKYQAMNGDTTSISSDYLLCLTPDSKGNLWIGTRAGGLNYFDKKKEKFTRFSEANGLSSNTIYGMVEDDDHNLWMGTATGLSCLDPSTRKFHNFYNPDGLVNTEFNRWSAVRDTNGILYFGGMNGIDYFKPEEVLQSRNMPPIVQFTAFKAGSQSQVLHDGLELHHKQNFITLEFAAMDFRNPPASQYMYKLEGANNDWIDAENNHTAMFAALPPGKYVFRVKAATQKGVWGQENSFAFSILAPWWQQGWFYILCAIIAGSILYGVYRFRINQLRKLYLVRTKISQDLHDEVGATLTSISFLSEVASNQASAGDQTARQTLNKIGEFSREMIGEMNDIVWAINPANDKFEKIADRIRNFAMPLLSAKNIQFNLEADNGLSHVSLNMQQRKNLYLIFKEALNNAAKYADCSNINVNISRENNHIRLDIIDNGKGFNESEIVAGNGLTNIRHRAKEIKADIQIRSGHREGTSVILSMPITQNT